MSASVFTAWQQARGGIQIFSYAVDDRYDGNADGEWGCIPLSVSCSGGFSVALWAGFHLDAIDKHDASLGGMLKALLDLSDVPDGVGPIKFGDLVAVMVAKVGADVQIVGHCQSPCMPGSVLPPGWVKR
jgi:hypothetical protein